MYIISQYVAEYISPLDSLMDFFGFPFPSQPGVRQVGCKHVVIYEEITTTITYSTNYAPLSCLCSKWGCRMRYKTVKRPRDLCLDSVLLPPRVMWAGRRNAWRLLWFVCMCLKRPQWERIQLWWWWFVPYNGWTRMTSFPFFSSLPSVVVCCRDAAFLVTANTSGSPRSDALWHMAGIESSC